MKQQPVSLDDFLNTPEAPPQSSGPMGSRPTHPSENDYPSTGRDDPIGGFVGVVLLAILPCRDVLPSSVLAPLPSFIGVAFNFRLAAYPGRWDGQLVATIWRLPAGVYRLDLGLFDDAQNLAGEALGGEITLERATIYTSIFRMSAVDVAAPGVYSLAARANGMVYAALAVGFEENA